MAAGAGFGAHSEAHFLECFADFPDPRQRGKVIYPLEEVLLLCLFAVLAGGTRDLLNILDAIGKAGATFKSLADAWADTTTAHGRLMLTVLGGLAEFEREPIKARTGEGRARAKARGVHIGHPPKLTAHQALRLNSAKVP